MTKPLGSWKEIADYFGKGVRTVQRWEATLGLPVHRSADESGAVIADPNELERWARNRELVVPLAAIASGPAAIPARSGRQAGRSLQLSATARERTTRLMALTEELTERCRAAIERHRSSRSQMVSGRYRMTLSRRERERERERFAGRREQIG